MTRYRDRTEAGVQLATLVTARGYADPVVLALVRGGVPVAAPVADALGVGLDVLVVRKLGVPWLPEVAFGALGPGGVRVLNPAVAGRLDETEIAEVTAVERAELERRELLYRPGLPPPGVGRAHGCPGGRRTGYRGHRAGRRPDRPRSGRGPGGAGRPGRARSPRWPGSGRLADEVLCPLVPADFAAVSRYYQEFPQVSDEEVRSVLATR